jgi:RNA 2',3'-cyclic 3'-phosphodiesterase
VTGDDRLRLFCALELPRAAVARIVAWQQKHLQEHLPGDRAAGRLVPSQNLHITLAFLGSRPASDVPAIVAELARVAVSAREARLRPISYRETRSVGMVVMEDVTGAATALAEDLGLRLERLGVYRREARPWLAHITVLRFRERLRLAPPPPELGEVRAVRCALYRSALGPGGARYDVLESIAIGGGR